MREFYKYHGTGNDFIILSGAGHVLRDEQIKAICARHTGIGADGVIVYDWMEGASDYDVRITIYNQDGSRPQMCGNGVRCLARYLVEKYQMPNTIRMLTDAGLRIAKIVSKNDFSWMVSVQMGVAQIDAELNALTIGEESLRWTGVNMGNPHAVVFEMPDIISIDTIGEYVNASHPAFPEGVNIEFVRATTPGHYEVIVYERGVGRTQACGTGACAVAAALWENQHENIGKPVVIEMPGGKLTIEKKEDFIWLTGSVIAVYKGQFNGLLISHKGVS